MLFYWGFFCSEIEFSLPAEFKVLVNNVYSEKSHAADQILLIFITTARMCHIGLRYVQEALKSG